MVGFNDGHTENYIPNLKNSISDSSQSEKLKSIRPLKRIVFYGTQIISLGPFTEYHIPLVDVGPTLFRPSLKNYAEVDATVNFT